MSIILLTFTVRLAILPLTFKQVSSMQDLQGLQPEMKKIQERYKDDNQRMNQEIMKLLPGAQGQSAGLLPAAPPSDPVLHRALLPAACDEFKADIAGKESFLFIADLAAKVDDRRVLVVLIVLYVGTQLVSSAVTAISADPTQRRIMFALPFVFVDLHHQLRGRPDRLLDHHQRVDDRPAAARAQAVPEAGDRAERPRMNEEAEPARGKPPAPRPAAAAAAVSDGKGKAPAATSGNGGPAKRRPAPRKKKKRTGRRR